MASIRWNQDLTRLRAHVQGLPEELTEVGAKIVAETAKEGADLMYRKIDRIDTEFMKGSVGNSDAKIEKDTISAEFGWGIEGAQVEPYFLYQEYGFRHVWSGNKIPPMHALMGAFVEVREKFFRRVKDLVS